ncbi:MAG: DNA polymerase [Candidatus Omnitrophota bacterium]
MQVHDELVFEIYKEELKKVKEIVRDKMENIEKMRVPIKTNISIGKNWLDLTEI